MSINYGTEYVDIFQDKYLNALKSSVNRYVIKVEILDHWENVLTEIINPISSSDKGQININKNNGVRRNCSLNLVDVDKEYLPSENSWFWFNRKFKVYIGLLVPDGSSTYWWSQGVFITTSASSQDKITHIEGVDKFGFLDGTIKIGMTDTKYIVPVGSTITNVICETLMLNMGNGNPIDPVAPLIDIKYNNIKTQQEIVIEEGGYIGEILTSLANSYSAYIYYDTSGHLVFKNNPTDSLVSAYMFYPHQWEYSSKYASMCNQNRNYSYENINAITVYTNDSKKENYSYTAYNTNPLSPLRIDSVGVRYGDSQEIIITETDDNIEDRCRQYAEYLLLQHCVLSLSVSFNSPIIPHMNVDETIGIYDDYYGDDSETYVVQSLTIPIGSGEMQVTASNVQWLPNNT